MSENCKTCGLPIEVCMCEERNLADIGRVEPQVSGEQQITEEKTTQEGSSVKVTTTKRKYGKLVTIVDFGSASVNVDELGSKLKATCACGGTVKGKVVELQGDHKQKVKKVLVQKMGIPEAAITIK